MMRLWVLSAYLCVCASVVQAQTKPQLKKTTVAVIEFKANGKVPPGDVNTLTNRFRGMLVQTDAYQVIEREQMNQILQEQDFTLTDACNSAECAVQVGQLLGVEQMIAGDIGLVGKTYTIDLRLIDITSGKILKTKTQDFQGDIDGVLDLMSDIAYSFANKKNPHPPKRIVQQKSSNKTLWYLLGAAAVGGGAYFVLGGGKSGGTKDIGSPSFPANP